MKVSLTTMKRRVKNGAALLDRQVPGWFRVVKISTLRMSKCEKCVLGQLFGSAEGPTGYSVGSAALGLGMGRASIEHGFLSYDGNYTKLGSLWRDEINKRRERHGR